MAYLSNFLSHRLWKSVILPYIIALIIFLVYLNVDVPDASTLVGYWSRGLTLLPNAWFIVALALMYLGFCGEDVSIYFGVYHYSIFNRL